MGVTSRTDSHSTSGTPRAKLIVALTFVLLTGVAAPAAAEPRPSVLEPVLGSTKSLWDRIGATLPDVHRGNPAVIAADELRAFELAGAEPRAALATAPPELAGDPALELSLPAPDGGFERFAVREAPVIDAELAAKHPEIRTYAGEGISDPRATVRISQTPLGFQASVRGVNGAWYIDPYYQGDRSVYVSYFKRDLENQQGRLREPGAAGAESPAAAAGRLSSSLSKLLAPLRGGGSGSGGGPVALANATGSQLRTYRLALVSDPSYAADFPGAVTAAKAALIARVNQIYEDETAIRLVLIGNNNLLNLDTAAQATGANGPCGGAPCYQPADLAGGCPASVTTRNRIVIGQIVGASSYDIGHIVLGNGGGGFGPGRVGTSTKGGGCTNLGNPVGDAFAVDFVAHEMGHQFSARHTWDGANCDVTQWTAGSNVEPGSGSSIMGYAGICGADNLQSNSDPHWSQKSHEQITDYVASAQAALNEVQTISLRNFDGTESFRINFNGNNSAPIQNGTNYNPAGITAAILAIPGWPAGGTVAVQGFGGGAFNTNGFEVTFGGTLAGADQPSFTLTSFTGDAAGFVGETDRGGPAGNGGATSATGNGAPSVNAPGPVTIPRRTPFTLTGSATDPDGDALAYLWEQNNAGAAAIALNNPAKTGGALFRQFGTALDSATYNGGIYNSPGLNHPGTSPSRTLPDMPQILANNTNADTGDCPAGTAIEQRDCYSEFLPTAVYAGSMSFRLTARDGNPGAGGVNSADTTVNLAPGTGPFRVTSPNTAGVTWVANRTETVTWDVAGTAAAPISTANVDILLSTDGGATFSRTLASGTPNDGSHEITVPDLETTQARVLVRAVGNIYFDVSNEDFTVVNTADMELVSKTDSQDPAFAGETLTYTIRARNNGPTAAENARVVDVLPAGTTYETSSIPCAEAPPGTLTCPLGNLADDEERTFTITVSIARDLVHNNGAPLTITNTATADSDRDDPDPSNDQKSEPTLVKAKADLEILSFDAIDEPPEMIVGEPATVTLSKLITNNGPSAPMDVRVARTAASTPNATVSPAATSHLEPALGYQEERTVDEQFEIECTGGGPATFTFTNDIAPDRPDDIDPDLANNHAEAAFTVECIVPIAINIKPGSFENPINLKSNGVIPVAALTTEAGEYDLPLAFDATTIHPLTARFGPKPVVTAGGGAHEAHDRGHIEDAIERSDEATRDGDLDMVLHFRTQESELDGTETEACVRGRFGPSDFVFQGCDVIGFVPD